MILLLAAVTSHKLIKPKFNIKAVYKKEASEPSAPSAEAGDALAQGLFRVFMHQVPEKHKIIKNNSNS